MQILSRIVEPREQIDASRKLFSNANLGRLILPLFGEQLLLMLVGIVDTLMISYAGEAAVSGVSLVNMFNIIFINLFTALASGAAVIISQYIGRSEEENAHEAAGQLMMISFLFSMLSMILVLIFNRVLIGFLFGRVDPDVMEACITYLRISAYSYPAIAVYAAGTAIFRSMGQTKITMQLSLASNVINVFGNAIGIFVLQAGVAGVAYPSLISRIFSAIMIFIFCLSQKNLVYLQWRYLVAWNKRMQQRILRIAIPNGVESGLFQLSKVALSSITALFGTVQIAANGVAQTFWSLSALVGLVMGTVYITVIGRCMGAGDIGAADYYMKKLLRITYLASFIWEALILILLFPMMKLFMLSAETIRLIILLVVLHNTINVFVFPISGALPNGFRAAGDVRYPLYASIFTTVICRIALSVVFAIWMNLGVIGIALAMCADWCIKAVMMAIHYKSGKWRSYRVI